MNHPNEISVQTVIPCGGSGTCLWPLSHSGFLKQFLRITCNESLFRQAAKWLACLGQTGIEVVTPIIIKGGAYLFLDSKQLTEPMCEELNLHRLANSGKITFVINEVQSGCFLGEDKIAPFEDTYGRINP